MLCLHGCHIFYYASFLPHIGLFKMGPNNPPCIFLSHLVLLLWVWVLFPCTAHHKFLLQGVKQRGDHVSLWTVFTDISFPTWAQTELKCKDQIPRQQLPECTSRSALCWTITGLELAVKNTGGDQAHSNTNKQNLTLWWSEGSWPPAITLNSRLQSRWVICSWGDTSSLFSFLASRLKLLLFPKSSSSKKKKGQHDTSSLCITPNYPEEEQTPLLLLFSSRVRQNDPVSSHA